MRNILISLCALAVLGCGGESTDDQSSRRPLVMVTTTIWGDVIEHAYGEVVDVEVLMPAGADPHHFSPSARQAARLETADLVVANGAGLEEGLTSVLDSVSASGVEVVELVSDGAAPHSWLDPVAVGAALDRVETGLVAVGDIDPAELTAAAEPYREQLSTLDSSIATQIAAVPDGRRNLVTTHDSMGAYADRYGLTVVGTVIASSSSSAEPTGAELDALLATIDKLDIPAIFSEVAESSQLTDAVAAGANHPVSVVELYVGSLGGPDSGADSYIALMQTNTDLIVEALG